MRFIPRREGSRKPVTATHNFDPSNPWGDLGSTNVSPSTVKGKKPADEVEREHKSATHAAFEADRDKARKARLGQRKQTPDDNAPRSYRNDID
jgi:hypothetical protein